MILKKKKDFLKFWKNLQKNSIKKTKYLPKIKMNMIQKFGYTTIIFKKA